MYTAAVPTTKDNVTSRLFLRYFLFYLVAVCFGVMLAARGVLHFDLHGVGSFSFAMIPLALMAGLLTVSRPYLLALTAAKALFDAALLAHMTALIGTGAIGILTFNACFLLTAFSLVLFCAAAARACWFAFGSKTKDSALIFSRAFAHYLAESILMTALALSLYFLWPRLALAIFL